MRERENGFKKKFILFLLGGEESKAKSQQQSRIASQLCKTPSDGSRTRLVSVNQALVRDARSGQGGTESSMIICAPRCQMACDHGAVPDISCSHRIDERNMSTLAFVPSANVGLSSSSRVYVCPVPVQEKWPNVYKVTCRGKAVRGACMVTRMKTMEEVSNVGKKRQGSRVTARVFVVGDNIDTDQIIPAEYLTLVPSNPDEYEKLGSYALIGLPEQQYPERYVKNGSTCTEYPIIIAGQNFGCGSSREHAPIAIGACGGCAVVAQSYARIFFRNCSATGELYPWESVDCLVDHFETGQSATIDFDQECIVNNDTGKSFDLKPLGDVLPVVDAGGIFAFARKSGMISRRLTTENATS